MALLAIGLVALRHWSASPAAAPKSVALHVLAGFSTSPTVQKKRAYAQVFADLAACLDPEQDFLSLYKVDRTCAELSSRPATGEGEMVRQTILHYIGPPASSVTISQRFWQAVTRRSRQTRRRMVIFYFLDGTDEAPDTSLHQQAKMAIRELASNSQVFAVVLCGVQPAAWARYRTDLAPFRERLQILGPTEVQSATLAAVLEQARD
jgi:hypothetical protein